MNVSEIIIEAILADAFSNHWEDYSRKALKHMARFVNYSHVPEFVIVDNEEVRSIVRWDRIDKMKLIRCLTRSVDHDIDDIDKLLKTIKRHDYRINDLKFLLQRRPEFIQYFDIDINKLKADDVANLLSLGHEYYLDKVDFSKYTFNATQSMNILKGYDFDRDILKKVNYKSFGGSHIVAVIKETDKRDLDILDISKLKNLDWLNLLQDKPDMLPMCDLDKFKRSDIFNSIKLYCLIEDKDLSFLILERDMKNIIPFGWEKLIIKSPEKFLPHCDLSKLNENNWSQIISERPELEYLKPSD
jgi:hypothetical protein